MSIVVIAVPDEMAENTLSIFDLWMGFMGFRKTA